MSDDEMKEDGDEREEKKEQICLSEMTHEQLAELYDEHADFKETVST